MKKLNQYIQEKFILNKNTKPIYKYFPKDKTELRKILEERLREDKNADLNDIDVSKITDMGFNGYNSEHGGLFEGLDPHNIDISKWDVSKVTSMNWMFIECKNFNSDVSHWDVSKCTNMGLMFCKCEKFDSDLSKWNVSKVTNMHEMLYGCDSLKNKPSWYKE